MKKLKLLTVNLTAKDYEKLKKVSKETQKPMTVIIRELLLKFLGSQI